MSKEIENAVSAIIEKSGVTVDVRLIGATRRDNWVCDEWRVSFTRGPIVETFEYFTGIGHRTAAQMPRDGGPRPRAGTVMYEQLERMRKPVAPHVAGVLHSIISDSSSVEQSFANWCGDFGYDTDSRKAYATYEACQRNADKLSKIFNSAERQALADALQDY